MEIHFFLLKEGAPLRWRSTTVLLGSSPSSPQGCFVCYGQNSPFHHDKQTCPTHKADMEAYKKAHGSKKRAPARVREAKMEASKDELCKLMMINSEHAKEIQETKRAWAPKRDKDKDKDKKGKSQGRNKGDGVHDVTAEENSPTLSGATAAWGPSQGGCRMVQWSVPCHPCRDSSIPPDVHQMEDWE